MLPFPLLLLVSTAILPSSSSVLASSSSSSPSSPFVARAPSLPKHLFHPTVGKVALASRGGGQGAGRMRKRAGSEEGAVWEGLGWDRVGGSYSVPVEVGTPPRTYYLQLDTASSDLLLASSLCSSAACRLLASNTPIQGLHPSELSSTPYVSLYNPSASTSFEEVNSNQTVYSVGFLDSTVAAGFVAKENVSWGGIVGPDNWRIVARNQSIGIITSTNLTLASQHISGIVGLGFPRLSTVANVAGGGGELASPLLNNLASNGTLAYPLFGIHLDRNTTLGGSLSIGAIDSSIIPNQSMLQWHPVVEFPPFNNAPPANFTSPYLQWSLVLTNVTMNGTAIDLNSTVYPETRGESWALLDAGSSGIFGPIEAVAQIFSLIDGSRMVADGRWITPCNSAQTMSFSFGGRDYVLQPSDWIMGRVASVPSECFAWPVALPPSGDGIGWQLGVPFLRAVYSVFYLGIDSLSPPLVGLYPLRNTTLSEPAAIVSSILNTYPTITANLPNSLLPLPTYSAPAYVFNTTNFYSIIINDTTTTYTSTNSIPIPSAGLASQQYTPLPLQADATQTVSTIPSWETPIPTVGPLDSSVIESLASARSSVFAQATSTYQNGLGSSSGARGSGLGSVESLAGFVAAGVSVGSLLWTL
ncbi:aspartic peptidase domain-containing protein [Mrakia frigida]|uniref:pepsin-like aspartic protease n=1 Tax=Mrakia frigida TaxID=29902 RepID=UPI003FCC036E